MKTWLKCFICVSLSLMCLFTCVGYAAMTGNLSISGSAEAAAQEYDVYITGVDPMLSAGVEIKSFAGTLLTAKVFGAGSATFTVNVKNISNQPYYYERTMDGLEAGIDEVYSGTEITYQVSDIAPMDELAPNGGTRSFTVTINVPENVSTDCYILKFNFVEKFATPDEEEFPEDMPSLEVNLVQRLSDILNNKYTVAYSDMTSRDYLIKETIRDSWSEWAPPYVGNMTVEYKQQVEALFGDFPIMGEDAELSFILKNEDLNDDGYNEIAMYTTSDPLDSVADWGGVGVVCVYVTVFTPVLDDAGEIAGYTMVCQSMRGYCYEVKYHDDYVKPSFSTDEWRDDVGCVTGWDNETNRAIVSPIPDWEMDPETWTKPYKYDFNSYNLTYWGLPTAPYGNTIEQRLEGQIPNLKQLN